MVIDLETLVTFWRDGADEDWAVAADLVQRGRLRHGLFFAHLALEKLLKAHVCRVTQDVAPRLHNLVRLAECARIELTEAQRDTLAEMNAFNVAGRYPDATFAEPTPAEARHYLARAGETFQWLSQTL